MSLDAIHLIWLPHTLGDRLSRISGTVSPLSVVECSVQAYPDAQNGFNDIDIPQYLDQRLD